MEKITAVEYLVSIVQKCIAPDYIPIEIVQQAKEMEKEQIKNAVIYGLDEDGHTGDWKISVAENYYIKTYTK